MGYRLQNQLIVAKTADYQVLPEDFATLFTTRGASSGTVTFTLPLVANLQSGWEVEFYSVGAAAMKIAAVADKIVTFNDADADALLFGTSSEIIGARVKVQFDGTSFLASWMADEAATVTVTS